LAIGHTECNEAYQALSLASSNLDSIVDTGSNIDTYGECIAKLAVEMKISVAAVVSVNTVARSGDMERLANKILDV
jgi:hypothetical protein